MATTSNARTGDPGVAKSVHGQNQNSSAITEIHTRLQEPNLLPSLWTYQATECIGRYYAGPGGYGVFSGAGTFLGVYPSVAVARSVVWQHHVDADRTADLGRLAA